MSNISPPLITNDPFSNWAESVHSSVKEKAIIRSKELSVSSNPFGSYIALHPEQYYTPLYMNYVGEWNPSGSYNVNDVVRVLPNKEYSLAWKGTPQKDINSETGKPYTAGQLGLNDNQAYWQYWLQPDYKPLPGTYICVAPVPSLNFWIQLKFLFGANVISLPFSATPKSKLTSLPSFYQKYIDYVRFDDVNYYPVYPEMPNIAELDVNDLSKYRGRYWELLSLLPSETSICVNGITKRGYTDSQIAATGSANYN